MAAGTTCKGGVSYFMVCVLTLLKPISFLWTQNAFKTLHKSSLLQVEEAMCVTGTGLCSERARAVLPLWRLKEFMVVEHTHRVQLYTLPIHITALRRQQLLHRCN